MIMAWFSAGFVCGALLIIMLTVLWMGGDE